VLIKVLYEVYRAFVDVLFPDILTLWYARCNGVLSSRRSGINSDLGNASLQTLLGPRRQ